MIKKKSSEFLKENLDSAATQYCQNSMEPQRNILFALKIPDN